ncbi:MAG: hypothetical protein HQ518_18580 [Rhodopirellula sp.]|nr:hypothetical protein [Rhodopirellula sp.]
MEQSKKDGLTAGVLISCVLLVVFWTVMANWSRRDVTPFELTADDFASFHLSPDKWAVEQLHIPATHVEPNILAYRFRWRADGNSVTPRRGNVRVRLVHGYNMPDCMRIKRYTVELLAETRRTPQGTTTEMSRPDLVGRLAEICPGSQVQVWLLTSVTGDVAIWVTGMLRAGTLEETPVDVCSMAYPRIGVPDDPSWLPEGFKLSSLRHPIRNVRWLIRAKWNNSRCDLATFLKLRRPAWASEEIQTLVVESERNVRGKDDLLLALEDAMDVYLFVQSDLEGWRRGSVE